MTQSLQGSLDRPDDMAARLVSGIARGVKRLMPAEAAPPASPEAIDRALLASIAGGDRAAFQQLYRRHERPLFAFLQRMLGNRAVAEEVVNDTMLAVWRFAGRYEGRSTPRTWITSIAFHKATSQLRRQKHQPQSDEGQMESVADHAKTPEGSAQDSSRARLFAGLLARLSPEHRTVMQLAYYQEMSIAEIASVMDSPEGTVKTRMFQARKRLAVMLAEAGIVAEAA